MIRYAEIDRESAKFARRNVADNNLDDRIKIIQVTSDDNVFPAVAFEWVLRHIGLGGFTELSRNEQHIDFTMCNPPFYGSREEVPNSAEAKELGPSGACTGAETEMITTGGEVAFVHRMVEESLQLRDRCQ